MALVRLQKILAQAGVASRRAAETMITEGRVRVNGRIVKELGQRADSMSDRIEVDGKRLVAEKPAYYVLNKPKGMVSTLSDPEGRSHLGELTKQMPERVFPVGRLDFHTSGVLLLTNDGEASQALLAPARHVPKTYVCKVRGKVDDDVIVRLQRGVALEDGQKTGPCKVHVIRTEGVNTWMQVTLNEGKNRQIHRMMLAVGLKVGRLSRLAFAGVTVDGMRPGEYRELTGKEIADLKKNYLNPAKRGDAHRQRSACQTRIRARHAQRRPRQT
jgi:23S rRNA pseudouridine2605 synthase